MNGREEFRKNTSRQYGVNSTLGTPCSLTKFELLWRVIATKYKGYRCTFKYPLINALSPGSDAGPNTLN